MDAKALDYFCRINPLARKIIDDQKLLQDAVGNEWNKLDWQKQEELLDDLMVDISVREKYAGIEKSHTYPSSFPNYKIETGEKIIVDFENDFWTWQDEHSSPFSWRTKSQQDLTLADLDSDVLSKPPTKNKKKNSEPSESESTKPAPREFSVETGTSIWESPFLQGMKKPDFLNRSQSSSPSKSVATSKESLSSRPQSPEAINYAFTGSMDDLSSNHSTQETNRSPSVSSGEILDSPISGDPEFPKSQKRQTTSPHRTVVNVTSSKKSDQNNDLKNLVKSKDIKEQNAFDNPALRENDWSSFLNQSADQSESQTCTRTSYTNNTLREPEPVSIDRGSYSEGIQTSRPELLRLDSDFKDEKLVVEIESPKDNRDSQNISMKTGFDFLDNW